MTERILWLSVAGTAGTLARYGLQGLVQRLAGGTFPWGTLSVNALGCLLFGLFWSLATERHLVSSEMRIVILAGFMGAFTTFSSYVFETGELLRNSQWGLAAGNFALENVIGFVALFLGVVVGRLL